MPRTQGPVSASSRLRKSEHQGPDTRSSILSMRPMLGLVYSHDTLLPVLLESGVHTERDERPSLPMKASRMYSV